MVRQTSDVLRRYGAIDDSDYQRVQAVGRDMKLLAVVGTWYRSAAERSDGRTGHAWATGAGSTRRKQDAMSEVLALAMRPFLSRCAEVLQQRPISPCGPIHTARYAAVPRVRGYHAGG